MPIYEYICAGCDHAFELLLRASERAKCPACGSRKLEKQWSTPAAHTSSEEPACPARESGACGQSHCPSGGCSLGF